MEINSQINTFQKGLNLDTDITMLPEGQYRHAENIRLLTDADGTTGMLQNIEYIRQYNGGISSDETIIGTSNTLVFDQIKKTTKEVGIVVTKKTKNNKIYNTVYIINGFESVNLDSIPIVKGYLALEDNVSIVSNYESNNASNVYISDGLSPIKVINIEEQLNIIKKLLETLLSIQINSKEELYRLILNNLDVVPEVMDKTKFDITPGAVLIPFSLVTKINGALPAGSILYCYQLFNLHGVETATSSLSEVIPITNTASNAQNAFGELKGEITNMGCQIKAVFKNDGRFDRARIFSIVYLDNTQVPDIYIANEIEIPSVKDNEFIHFTYNDAGNSYLSKITIDEFNAYLPYEFTAKSIEKLSNRLFASNIQEITWDVNFDARAYRCNSNKAILLQSSDVSKNISGYLNDDGNIYSDSSFTNKIDIDDTHDCINPSNVNVLTNDAEYTYGYDSNGNLVHGGTGPNISYRFVFTELRLSGNVSPEENVPAANLYMDNTPAGGTSLIIYYEDGNVCSRHIYSEGKNTIPNYSDPYICSNFLGYQRDEIYRFGIIFYNNKNIPTPVHWIGDIKMPASYYTDKTESLLYPFHCGKTSDTFSGRNEMLAYALGIQFTVKNIPSEATAYEIVRCDRTQQDRTVLMQGALSATVHYDDPKYNYGSSDTRPLLNFALPKNNHNVISVDIDNVHRDSYLVRNDCFEFVSPEICVSKNTINDLIRQNHLNPIYYNYSYFPISEQFNTHFCIKPLQVYNVSEDKEVIENDDLFFTWSSYKGSNESYLCTGRLDYLFGKTAIFKYYGKETENRLNNLLVKCFKIEDSIVNDSLPFQIKFSDTKSYLKIVGNYAYINESIAGDTQGANHGINAILEIKNFDPFIQLTEASGPLSAMNEFNTTAICNIKQNIIPYNGNSYINRQNSVYQSCGAFKDISDYSSNYVMCYGGDTYLNIFDYQNTTVRKEKNIEDDYRNHICVVSYIPLESAVNTALRSDESFSKTVKGMIGQNLIQNEPTSISSYNQKMPLYVYNPVYSVTSGSKHYLPKSIYAEDDSISNNRIVCSELKTNNELTDSWSKFKFANYLDVDTKYGEITNLKAFGNKLYFWLANAVGIASVNERSLITDNNMAELTLGTGGILTRFDYVAILNGSSIVNDKSITHSATTLYWYDFDKNEICALGNGVLPLSKTKSVQSYLNTLPRSAKKNAVSFYDKKYNEVWFRIYDRALVYNELLQVFTSFYTHNPNWFFPFSDKLVTIKDNNMYYLHNIYEVNSNTKEERISKVQFVVNKDVSNTKVFDNVVFSAELFDNDNTNPNIIKDVVFKTKTQETEAIDFNSIELREDNYRFPISREKVDNENLNQLTSQSYLGRMRGKYLICDYTFDCNNNREFKLPYIKTTYRYSML